MKYLALIFFSLICCITQAQKNNRLTDGFVINGNVKHTITFSLKDAGSFTSHFIDSVVIYNHLHERKRVIRNIKGVLLKDVLEKAGLDEENPKLFSQVYFACIASDGYKVVFSRNEIFNTELGNKILIITEEGGQKAGTLNDHIAILSPLDKATGRRYVQNLEQVKVERVK